MSLAEEIKSIALNAGFHAVGITSAEPFLDAELALDERRRLGLLQGTQYGPATIHRHTHPQETMHSARSIISLALSYLTDDMENIEADSAPRGWIARFARGKDYHQALHARLLDTVNEIRRRTGGSVEIRSFADTGPMVDRAIAARAGVGSVGKNTCLCTHELGSWVVLGEIVTDLQLEPDAPTNRNICGECDQCMNACPTGALCSPYTIDTKLCLSQVTQSKGWISADLRTLMGTRIYGCDSCQSACPHNNKVKPGNLEESRPSSGLGNSPELIPILQISPSDFKLRVAPTTAGWIRRTRLRRNAAVALGNLGDPAGVVPLIEAMTDPEPVIRGHAAWALGKIGTSAVRRAIENALSCENDEQVLQELRDALHNE